MTDTSDLDEVGQRWVAEQLKGAPPVSAERGARIARIIVNGLQEQAEDVRAVPQ